MKEINLRVDDPLYALPTTLEKEKVEILTSSTNKTKKVRNYLGLITANFPYVVIVATTDIVSFSVYFLLIQSYWGKKLLKKKLRLQRF